MATPTKLVHVRIEQKLVALADVEAERRFINRSEFIRQAVAEKLRQTTKNAVPSEHGVNILMTDVQLDELRHTLNAEAMRRRQRGYGRGWR